MELFEYHFSNLHGGNLIYNSESNTYELFSKNEGKHEHINYLTFKEFFNNLINIKEPVILESGIASAGTQSTYLFNEYIRKYGGKLYSVDINNHLVEIHKGNMCPATQLICSDSVTYFSNWAKNNEYANAIYLDSYDLDLYNPAGSEEHGLKEYKALLPVIKNGTILLVDDTPISPDWLDTRGGLYNDMVNYYKINGYVPGKGRLILNEPKNADLLLHQYQVLYKFK